MTLKNKPILVLYRKILIAMKCLVSCYPDFVIACAAINGAIILRYEWHLCLGSALSTNDCMHFTGTAITVP